MILTKEWFQWYDSLSRELWMEACQVEVDEYKIP